MLGLDMFILDNLFKIVYNDFLFVSFDLCVIGYLIDVSFYQKMVWELFLESKECDDVLSGFGFGVLDVGKWINSYDFLFVKMLMKWYGDYQLFVFMEKNNGLIFISGDLFNK